jgi:hypothetical protein
MSCAAAGRARNADIARLEAAFLSEIITNNPRKRGKGKMKADATSTIKL